MGCLFGCFGIRADRHRPTADLVSEPPPSNSVEPIVHRNRKRLGSLLLSDEKDGSLCNEKQYQPVASSEPGFDLKGLKVEAKFLQACGTLPETPAEIRKVSITSNDSLRSGDSESLKFNSWLPNTSIQKLNLMQPDQPTPIKLCDKWVSGSGSSAHTTSSCITSGQIPERISPSITKDRDAGNFGTGIHAHTNQTASAQSKNESVRFDYQSDLSSTISSKGSTSEVYSEHSKQSESPAGNGSVVLKPSPYPTPLQLSEDMQTPGTVFPSYVGNGKNPRIRSHYVSSVLNPVENLSKWNLLKEEDSNSNSQSANLTESFEQADYSKVDMIENSVEKDFRVESSLSSWLKPPQTNQNAKRVVSFASENAYFGKTPGDRPILGMVAAHWNEDEHSRVSPKWWDGNGIPNSTTKYKEDQKVSWHATPFEERLEKALSEESSIAQRKNLSGRPPMEFNENEECDTALSQMKSSTHLNSVVSC